MPVVFVGVADSSGAEAGSNPIEFSVTRSNAFKEIVVNLTWSGTATYDVDYTSPRPAGRSRRRRRQLTLGVGVDECDDLRHAGRRHLVRAGGDRDADARASAPATRSAARRPEAARSSTTIGDRVTVDATDPTGVEQGADPIVFTITRTGSSATIVVALGWSGTAIRGTDYTITATGGTLAADGLSITLGPGVTSATITATPVNDTTVESTETVTLTLGSGSGYTVGDSADRDRPRSSTTTARRS